MRILVFLAFLLSSIAVSAQKPALLTNQVGYDADKPKRAVLLDKQKELLQSPTAALTGADAVSSSDKIPTVKHSFLLIDDSTGKTVYQGELVYSGSVDRWKRWIFWTLDFSSFGDPGVYRLQVDLPTGSVSSHPFRIGKNILEKATLSDVVYYFKGQRASGLLDKADHHLFLPAALQAPPLELRAVALGQPGQPTGASAAAPSFGEPTVASPASATAGDTIDLHGGWYDATGDYGKHLSHLSFSSYFNPQQIPLVVWSLIKSNELLQRRPGTDFRQFMRRFSDEAAYGADYLCRVHIKGGSFYRSVGAPGPAKAPQDRGVSPEQQSYRIKQSKDQSFGGDRVLNDWSSYETSYRSGGGMAIAALAMAYTANLSGDYTPSEYLQAAEDAFAFLEKENLRLTNDGKENILDDYCALNASTELLKATHQPLYQQSAEKRALRLIGRLLPSGGWRADDGDRPFFHPSDAGLPLVSLLYYYPYAPKPTQAAIRSAVRRSLRYELAITDKVVNPFGYSRQLTQDTLGHRREAFFFPQGSEASPWWQGEDARLASMSAAARLAIPLFADDAAFSDSLQRFALDQLNWILGLNPYDASMLQGTGWNNPGYSFFGTFEYTNAPGGIVNGITSGLNDEEAIDFNLSYAQTGKDYDWRWAEQWLPHAAWYLLAVSAGQPSMPVLPLRDGVIDYRRLYSHVPAGFTGLSIPAASGTAAFNLPSGPKQPHTYHFKYDWSFTEEGGKYLLRLVHFYEQPDGPGVSNEYSKLEYRWWDFWHHQPWRDEDHRLFDAFDSTIQNIFEHPEQIRAKPGLDGTPSWYPYAKPAFTEASRSIMGGTALKPRFNALVLYENGGHHLAYSQRARQWLDQLAADSGFAITYITHPDTISAEFLSKFQLFIQLDYAPYGWPVNAARAFEDYIREGRGGWVGFHHATLLGEFDGYSIWPWFQSFMGGIRWKDYIARFAEGTVHLEDRRHPVLNGVPDSFVVKNEEWYTYDKSPRPNVHVLARVDESSYRPDTSVKMGDHPVIWTNEQVAARNVYIFMGHDPGLFDDPVYKKIFSNSIFYAAAGRGASDLVAFGASNAAAKTSSAAVASDAAVASSAAVPLPAPASPAKPLFRVLAFYSNQVEPDHRAFARDIIRFYSDLARAKGFAFDTTSSWEHSKAELSHYRVVLWLNDFPHTEKQRSAFRQYMEHGGAWLGFHVAGYNDKDTHWPWFVHFFGDAVFYNNSWPPLPAKLVVEDLQHPVTCRLPEHYTAPINEWYGWRPNPRDNKDIHVLVSLDTANYPLGKKDIISGGDIPVVWTNTRYKMLYLNMGHGDLILSSPIQDLLFEDALLWLGRSGGAK